MLPTILQKGLKEGGEDDDDAVLLRRFALPHSVLQTREKVGCQAGPQRLLENAARWGEENWKKFGAETSHFSFPFSAAAQDNIPQSHHLLMSPSKPPTRTKVSRELSWNVLQISSERKPSRAWCWRPMWETCTPHRSTAAWYLTFAQVWRWSLFLHFYSLKIFSCRNLSCRVSRRSSGAKIGSIFVWIRPSGFILLHRCIGWLRSRLPISFAQEEHKGRSESSRYQDQSASVWVWKGHETTRVSPQ